jgi:hypothetical protein
MAVEEGLKDPRTYSAMMMHEVMHLAQMDTLANMLRVVDLTPIRDVCVKKRQEATEQAAKDQWTRIIDEIDEEIDENKATWANKHRRSAANVGLDVTANRAVEESFPDSLCNIDALAFKVRNKPIEDPNRPGILWTVESLSYDVKKQLPSNKDWWFYICEYIEHIAKQLDENSEANSPPKGSSAMEVFVSQGEGQDQHDFNTDSGSADRQNLKEAVAKAMEEGKLLAHHAGSKAADSKFITSSEPLSEKIESLLRAIKVKFCRIYSSSNEDYYRFERDNRKFPDMGFPGALPIEMPKPSVVMVIDTSGSMWTDTLLNQMIAAARRYSKKGQLAALYCCDVELTKVSYDHSFNKVALKGGGGTIFNSGYVDVIVNDLGSSAKSSKPDIIYLTDEAVIGLDTAKANKRARLHVINVERALGNV